MFTRFEALHERDGHQTDGQTPHDGMATLTHSVARQKLNHHSKTDPCYVFK